MRAHRGVILGSGGFEQNEQMRAKYQRAADHHRLDHRRQGQHGRRHPGRLRARRRVELMDDAWWGPTIPLAGGAVVRARGAQLPRLDHRQPAGKRFMNEALPYVEAVPRDVRRASGQGPGPGGRAGLDGRRPALPQPLPVRGIHPRQPFRGSGWSTASS